MTDEDPFVSIVGAKEQSWRDDAACVGENSEIFFPGRGESTELAKLICDACPVRLECLNYALTNSEHHGIWGGLSERERRRVRRIRRTYKEAS